jgi:hypothetical protein
LLGGSQRCLALAGERNAALESLERFFERHITLFEPGDEGFEFEERLFEVGQLLFLLGVCFHAAKLAVTAREGQTIAVPD